MAVRLRPMISVDTPAGRTIIVSQYSTDGKWYVMAKVGEGRWFEPKERLTKAEAIGVQKFLASLPDEKLVALA